MPIPKEMRRRMITAVERGESVASVAGRFEVSQRGLHKIIRAYRERGTLEPAKPGPKKPTKLTPADDAKILALLESRPGITLKQIASQLSVKVVESTVHRRLAKLGISLKKKTMIASEQQRPEVAVRRRNFMIARRFLKPEQLVFLDESGAKTNMTRLYGRAPIGKRCRFWNPHGHWRTTTMLSAIRVGGVIKQATILFDGAMNAITFQGYVESCLAPALRPGDVVVMDNLSSHKGPEVEQAIAAAGASIWWLPPYSPDLNPIEKLWSKIKAWLRSSTADIASELVQVAGQAFRAVTAEECRNYFRSCGYRTELSKML